MRKMVVLTMVVLVLLVLTVNTANAVQPLRFVTVQFADGTVLNCRVSSTSEPCTQAYGLDTIVSIRLNGRQIGLNPYLGLTEFVPTNINDVMIYDGQIGG